jgi:hypothetical protein
MPVAKAIVMFAGFSSYKRCYKSFLPTSGFTLWLFFTAAHAQTPESTASLRGIVTNASGGGGLREAYLQLSPVIGSNGRASFSRAGCTKRIKRSDPTEKRLVWMVRRSSSSRPTCREISTSSGIG